MNRCKNCKYFKRHDGTWRWNKYGECQSQKFIYGASQQNETASIYETGEETTETDLLLYEDAEGYNAWHEVGQDFGCIHYEEAKDE